MSVQWVPCYNTVMSDPNVHKVRAIIADGSGDTETADRERELAEADRATALLRQQGLLRTRLDGHSPEDDAVFKRQLRGIAEANQVQPKVLYNPGSGHHVSLAMAFPKARTVFLDTNPEVVHDLLSHDFEAYQGDMHTFTLPAHNEPT